MQKKPVEKPAKILSPITRHVVSGRGIILPLVALLAGLGMVQIAAADTIHAVGVENEYANVIGQIGGEYVTVSAIESNPDTDPHAFEASPARGSRNYCGADRGS